MNEVVASAAVTSSMTDIMRCFDGCLLEMCGVYSSSSSLSPESPIAASSSPVLRCSPPSNVSARIRTRRPDARVVP